MQVSFRLLAQAQLLLKTKEHLDKQYIKEQGYATQKYMLHLQKVKDEYTPAYMALQRELNLLWEEVKQETGINNVRDYAILEDGFLVRTDSFCGDLWGL